MEHFIAYDEAGNITSRMLRAVVQHNRKTRAKGFGWTNWYVNHGRMSLPPTKSELRQVSWRRAR